MPVRTNFAGTIGPLGAARLAVGAGFAVKPTGDAPVRTNFATRLRMSGANRLAARAHGTMIAAGHPPVGTCSTLFLGPVSLAEKLPGTMMTTTRATIRKIDSTCTTAHRHLHCCMRQKAQIRN